LRMPELRTITDVFREIRRVATFVAIGTEFRQRMKKGELHRHMAIVLHGNPQDKSLAPYCKQICQGVGFLKDDVPDLFEVKLCRLRRKQARLSRSGSFTLKTSCYWISPDASQLGFQMTVTFI